MELEELFGRVVDQLESRLEGLAAAGLGAMQAGVPGWLQLTEPAWAELEEHLRASLWAALASFRAGILPGCLPAADAALIDIAAEIGDLEALLAGYRFAQTSLWGAWFDLVHRATPAGRAKGELLARGSRFFMRYSELGGRYLAAGYRQRMDSRTGLSRRRAGDPLEPPSQADLLAETNPDFELSQHHICLLAWGKPPGGTVRELAARLDRVPRVRAHGSTSWVCLSGHKELSQRHWRALRGFDPAPGVRLACGLEGFGVEGLNLSFRQALQARRLADPEAAVTHYADVAVEALALRGEENARAFVEYELRGIEDGSSSSERLRETLAAYIGADLNAASAAAALGVHHQTVANRLRVIEERLGRPLVGRTLELALALRLRSRFLPRPER